MGLWDRGRQGQGPFFTEVPSDVLNAAHLDTKIVDKIGGMKTPVVVGGKDNDKVGEVGERLQSHAW